MLVEGFDGDEGGAAGEGVRGGGCFSASEAALSALRGVCGRTGSGSLGKAGGGGARGVSSLEVAVAQHEADNQRWAPVGSGSSQYRHYRYSGRLGGEGWGVQQPSRSLNHQDPGTTKGFSTVRSFTRTYGLNYVGYRCPLQHRIGRTGIGELRTKCGYLV